ncbi:5104_t:CDS:1, partial [Funneliformis caledonium]
DNTEDNSIFDFMKVLNKNDRNIDIKEERKSKGEDNESNSECKYYENK